MSRGEGAGRAYGRRALDALSSVDEVAGIALGGGGTDGGIEMVRTGGSAGGLVEEIAGQTGAVYENCSQSAVPSRNDLARVIAVGVVAAVGGSALEFVGTRAGSGGGSGEQ